MWVEASGGGSCWLWCWCPPVGLSRYWLVVVGQPVEIPRKVFVVYPLNMPLGDFVEAGSSPKPLRIGRSLRLIFGLAATGYFVWNLFRFNDLVGVNWIDAGYLAGIAAAWWYLSDAFTVGFGLKWGRWPQIAAIAVALVLLVFGFVANSSEWGTPLQWGGYLMSQFFYGFIGPSFILAALFAVPG